MKQGSKLKKTALALTATLGLLGLSGVASAAMYEGCVRPNVELPCEDTGWSFSAAYLLVQPTADGLAYAQTIPEGVDMDGDPLGLAVLAQTNLSTGRVHELSPGFNSSGLKLDASYYYSNGYDFAINWTRIFQRNVGRDTGGLPLLGGAIPAFVPFPTSLGGVHADGSLENDEAGIEWGRKVLYGERVVTRTHFDISYLRVKSTLDTRTFNFPGLIEEAGGNIVGPDGHNNISNEESRFNGVGPRVGVDTWYDIGWWNLSLVGHATGALYVGQLESKAAIRQFPLNFVEGSPGPSTDNFSTRTVVPAAKIWGGAEYNYLLPNNSVFSAEIGYIWAGFFNSIRNPLVAGTASPRITALTNPGLNSAGDVGNFGYHGLYFDFKWRAYT